MHQAGVVHLDVTTNLRVARSERTIITCDTSSEDRNQMGELDVDPAARFQQLYEQSYRSLVGYARRRTANPEDAADVVADTFLVAWRRMSVIPPGDEAVPWLYGVARNVINNQRRGARRRDQLARRLQNEPQPLSVEETEAVETSATTAALSRLSAVDREVLCLQAWEGLTASELAVALGCSNTAARVRLMRARRRFAQRFRQLGGRSSAQVGGPREPQAPTVEGGREGERHRG